MVLIKLITGWSENNCHLQILALFAIVIVSKAITVFIGTVRVTRYIVGLLPRFVQGITTFQRPRALIKLCGPVRLKDFKMLQEQYLFV